MVGLTSAAGLVGFLAEPDPQVQTYALARLNEDIDTLWTEVAPSISQIEALYEDESFPQRELAALVASKVYYQLGEYNESMVFALGAGKLFDLDHPGEFEDTIVAKCVDTYIALSSLFNPPKPASSVTQELNQLTTSFPSGTNGEKTNIAAGLSSPTTPFSQSSLPSKSLLSRQDSSAFDPSLPGGGNAGVPGAHPSPLALNRNTQKALQAVISRLFEACYRAGAYRQVVGIAVEARNLAVLREAIVRSSEDGKGAGKKPAAIRDKSEDLMDYLLDICMNVVQERGLRNEILQLILDLLNQIPNPDYFAIAKCVVYLNEYSMASNMLRQLVEQGNANARAIAYQLSFDLYDNGTQEFLSKVMDELPEAEEKKEEKPQMNGSAHHDRPEPTESDRLLSEVENRQDSTTSLPISRTKQRSISDDERKVYDSVRHILRGTKSIELNLEFLYRNNKADRNILNKVRDSLEARNSIFHVATTVAQAFSNAGTTNDSFFRDNLEWLGKAVNWSKFTATAALGVLHKGNIGQGQKLLEPYLPKDSTVAGSTYSQGGALYALGLIYSNHGTHVLDYLRDQFNRATDEVVQHGGALGLGVAAMATGSEELFDNLKSTLYTDSAVSGEAVGLAMGLVMLGSGNEKAKIVRGCALGIAVTMLGRQESADKLIQGLLDDAQPALRYSGVCTLALAYCGTGSNKAVRKLLHAAVSDVSDDVRRMAVMSLGFILFRKPSAVPRIVELLSESYNPHVRYGAAMCLGLAAAGTGLEEAIDILEPMTKDSQDFVRQGAFLASALIMVQQNEAQNPKAGTIRKTLQKVVSDRHEEAMTKWGASVSLGILDAGGRNCTISLQTQTGNLNMNGIVSALIFTQYWYWFPFTLFLSGAMTPTAIIGVDQDLEVPSFKFYSATRPSVFGYPPEQEVKTSEEPEKVKTAVLSTTAQAKRRKQAKERQARKGSMDIDHTPTTPKPTDDDKMDVDEDTQRPTKEDKGEEAIADSKTEGGDKEGTPNPEGTSKKKAEKEKVGYELENMSRVLPAQLKYISFPEERYRPVKKPTGGVILLTDSKPSEAKSLLEMRSKKASTPAAPATGVTQQSGEAISTSATGTGGAIAGAGVLTAVDEDDDGEEAEVPREFDYQSDNEGEE
ncbi:MAG: hypothetical protein Q9157_002371 [Trypethelium eluteriae]